MMSSKFNPGRSAAIKPKVCIKPIPGRAARYESGLPKWLNVFASWLSQTASIDVSASFPIAQVAALPQWTGSSSDVGTNLIVDVAAASPPETYHFRLSVREDEVEIYSNTWFNIFIGTIPPFNSTLLNTTWASGTAYNRLQVLD